jgi:2-polyprenyl-6-methoxyphenol hydroxylase-like FAD-dependent oxidoreductase
MHGVDRFDVVVVGASVAGCAAARGFAQAGLRVALIERRPDPQAYKVACTHVVLSSAAGAIERLGLAALLEARGAVRVVGDAWTPYGGWIRAPDDAPRGWGVTRRTLDPMLRELAAGTPGVELLTGETATRLVAGTGPRPEGVETEDQARRRRAVSARLVVGADGRRSTIARLARVPGRVRPNNRFAYFAYWRGVRPRTDRARLWLLDPDGAAQFPNEDDLTVMAVVAHRSRLAEFRDDREGAYARALAELPDGPDLGPAERVSKLIGALDMPNASRPAAGGGVAFVGDAALATDPLFGVGLSWAFQSAEWLVEQAAPALLRGGDLDAALERYRRTFRRRLGLHHYLIADYSTGRGMYPWERALYRAGAADERVARVFDEVGSRRRSPLRLFDPRVTRHVMRALAHAQGAS